MPGISHTLEIARQALATQQGVLSIIGHNVANANSPGYSRQVAHLETARPTQVGNLIWGEGVTLSAIERKRAQFVDSQLRQESSGLGRWQTRAAILSRVESLLAEPSDEGLAAALDDFWAAWSELSSSPQDASLRSAVRERGRILTEMFRRTDSALARIATDVDAEIRSGADELSQRLTALADLNRRIRTAEGGGATASDLRDQRDLLLDELAALADVRWGEREDGTVAVRLAGVLLVDGDQARPLEARTIAAGDGTTRVTLSVTGSAEVEIEGGSLGGLLELREETLPGLRAGVSLLAHDLAAQVNALHRTGPSGTDFFSGSSASDLALAPAIAADAGAVNVSSSGTPGENDLALAIAQLQDARIIDHQTATASDYWSGFVGRAGTIAAEAQFQEESANLALEALEAQRQSTQGVSLEEEMAAMITTQQAYLAAARVFDVTSSLFDALLGT